MYKGIIATVGSSDHDPRSSKINTNSHVFSLSCCAFQLRSTNTQSKSFKMKDACKPFE